MKGAENGQKIQWEKWRIYTKCSHYLMAIEDNLIRSLYNDALIMCLIYIARIVW